MFAQVLPSRRSLALFISSSLVVLLIISAAGAESARLEEEVLAKSRGRDQGSSLNQTLCDTTAGNSPCSAPEYFCQSCDSTYYTTIVYGGPEGGYNGPTGSGTLCGRNMLGYCDASLQCVTSDISQVGICETAGPVTLQNPPQ